jgi:hypothetical protein
MYIFTLNSRLEKEQVQDTKHLRMDNQETGTRHKTTKNGQSGDRYKTHNN